MKKGNILMEMFSSDDFSLEKMEELNLNENLVQMRLKSCFKGADNIIIESNNDDGEKVVFRLTKNNPKFNQNMKPDKDNKRFFTLSKIELKINGNEFVKGQQCLRDGRLVRVAFQPR